MSVPVFLLDPLPEGAQLLLDGAEGRHAARVRRLAPGEALRVTDGRGSVADCLVAEVRADGLLLAVLGRHAEPPPVPRLVVIQALPKGARAELAVELLTELGVDEIVPWAASRSIVQWRDGRADTALERWRRTAAEAAKQSRRAWVPTVSAPASTAQVAARLAGVTGLILDGDAAVSVATVELSPAPEVAVVVGPEGGIAAEEVAAFAAAGAAPVRLGALVLRTSTAGAAALAALSVRLGRWP